MPPRFRRTRGLVAILIAALTVCALAALAPAHAAVAAPVVTPSAPMANETVRFTGATPTRVRRPVTLQRRAGTRWVVVTSGRTNRQGRYSLLGRLPARAPVRAVARRITLNGRTYAAWTSAARVIGVVGQAVTLTVPATGVTGEPVAASAVSRPIRPGRTVRLQSSVGGTWTTVATDTQDATGRTTWTTTPASAADVSYRAVAVAWKGAAAKASAVRTVTVTDPPVPGGGVQRVSVALDGGSANNYSGAARVSGDGRWVAFASHASNLVAGDTEGKADVFLRDLQSGTTVRVSQTPSGVGGDQSSWNPDVSDDGRYVTYRSSASNLGFNGGNRNDVLVWDRTTGQTVAASLPFGAGDESLGGAYDGPFISGDGSTVVWVSDDPDLAVDDDDLLRDAYAWDRETGTRTWVSHGQEASPGTYSASNRHVNEVGTPSDDGTKVPFVTAATLVPGVDPGPGCCTTQPDVYVWNDFGDENVVELATINSEGEMHSDSDQAAMSGDGERVVFVSGEGFTGAPSDSTEDVFVSGVGDSYLQVSTPAFAETARGTSYAPETSDDGGTVVFSSRDEFLVVGQPANNAIDVFRWVDGTIEVVSQDVDGGAPNAPCGSPDVSGDGSTVVFDSSASDLVAGDANGVSDVFVVAGLD